MTTKWPQLNALPTLENAAFAGVYRVDIPQAEHLAQTGARLGFHLARADLSACGAHKTQMLNELSHCLAMPATCARNWDALEDGLNDLSWLPAGGYVIIASADPRLPAVATALEILQTSCRQWAARRIPMWVFILDTGNSSTKEPDL